VIVVLCSENHAYTGLIVVPKLQSNKGWLEAVHAGLYSIS
jgi:hypothetical protein